MGSTVKLRPNHYEVLGLTPGASSDEIARAFAKELSDLRPRPFGSLAEVTVAFETLRDRSKREAYDISLGLKPKPKPSVTLGEDLTTLSVAELEARIAALQGEIERVKAELGAKKAHEAAAAQIFKR